MKELFNYCPVPTFEHELSQMQDNLSGLLKELKVDGIELLVYDLVPYVRSYKEEVIGVHLKYWPYWLDFWNGNEAKLKEQFSNKASLKTYFNSAATTSEFIEVIKTNIRVALAEQPEYLVWHVSNADIKELFTFKFAHTDEEVVIKTAEIFNLVSEVIPLEVCVLFENLWWPGLGKLDAKIVNLFFSLIKRENVGIMLDTGHLMNTNPKLKSEAEGIAYITEVVMKLGTAKAKIKGMHLSSSLSGEYVKSFSRVVPEDTSLAAIYHHVCQIDQHRPFSECHKLRELIELIKPEFLVHELSYDSLAILQQRLALQKSLLK